MQDHAPYAKDTWPVGELPRVPLQLLNISWKCSREQSGYQLENSGTVTGSSSVVALGSIPAGAVAKDVDTDGEYAFLLIVKIFQEIPNLFENSELCAQFSLHVSETLVRYMYEVPGESQPVTGPLYDATTGPLHDATTGPLYDATTGPLHDVTTGPQRT
eukprot:Em0001g965a